MKTLSITLYEILVSGLLIGWLFLLPIAWTLRDGLGPSARESSGFSAITRSFWTFYWGPVFCILAVMFILLINIRKNKFLSGSQ